jgi:hypothetical protein
MGFAVVAPTGAPNVIRTDFLAIAGPSVAYSFLLYEPFDDRIESRFSHQLFSTHP